MTKFAAVSYNRNVGLALDAGLTLMLRRRAHGLASVLKRGAHRLALKREASQTCICVEMRSYTGSHFNVETRP